jgi:hypothetical protein
VGAGGCGCGGGACGSEWMKTAAQLQEWQRHRAGFAGLQDERSGWRSTAAFAGGSTSQEFANAGRGEFALLVAD